MSELVVQERVGRLRFDVRVQPRASKTEVAGIHGGALKVRLQAPPVDGAANAALVAFLAASLGVGRTAVRVVAGLTSRSKVVEVDGVRREQLEALATAGAPR